MTRAASIASRPGRRGRRGKRALHGSQRIAARVPVADAADEVEAVIGRLRAAPWDAVDAVYVVDRQGRFAGAVPLAALLGADGRARLGTLVDASWPRVEADLDQKHAAGDALHAGTTAVAVVDHTGLFLGAVTARALLEIVREEHVADLHRLAGIRRETEHMREAMEVPPLRRARHRLPWLVVGLVGSLAAAVVVARFEEVLKTNVAVAYFVPMIVYIADAIGTQTEAVVVRGLSLARLPLRRMLGDELRTGAAIGVALAALAFPVIAWTMGDLHLAAAVAAAIVVAGSAATSIGLCLPWALQRVGFDPALGSGPLATIIQDVLSLVIYFAMATWLLL